MDYLIKKGYKMTTLQLFCKVFGWQGGTLHQAKERFSIASIQEMDRLCGAITDNTRDISDIDNALYFTRKRNEALKLHIRGLSK